MEKPADIGIDLGTTFSVLAIKGNVKLAEGYSAPDYFATCDVTILPNLDGEKLVPSVFWVDKQDPLNVLVGSEAKQKAEEGEAPIMFSKRWIGTTEALRIHDRSFTAREVAAAILRHLKTCAERALGRPVRRAVITHPAYFQRNQVAETLQAAIDAGFDMSQPDEQMLMEPTAAALSYVCTDARDPLLVMTFDLGGGTFDVTVLERREGIIRPRAFDGDHLLGGYNFDSALVQWLLDRQKRAGKSIPYDETKPDDRARRSRMLQVAESVKVRLFEQKNSKVAIPIKALDILVDEAGRAVQIQERINGEEYAGLIRDELDKTIACSIRALIKARLSVPVSEVDGLVAAGLDAELGAELRRVFAGEWEGDLAPFLDRLVAFGVEGLVKCGLSKLLGRKLDKILLVGGSTYPRWVRDAVARAFPDVEIEQHEPDLCVAVGAAIKAGTLGEQPAGKGILVRVDNQPTSSLPTVSIGGSVMSPEGAELPPDLAEQLRASLETPAAGTLGPIGLGPQGKFLFDEVRLLDGHASEFVLLIRDGVGAERLRHPFALTYQPDGESAIDIPAALPKSIYIRAYGGMVLVAEEGKPLPITCSEIRLKQLHPEETLPIPICQADAEVGCIVITGIPETAGANCVVVLNLEITRENKLEGIAKVLTQGGALVAESRPSISFPPVKLPDLPTLRAQFEELEAERQQLVAVSNDSEERTRLGASGRKQAARIQKYFANQDPDKLLLARELREFQKLVHPPDSDMNPSRKSFFELLDACKALVNQSDDKQVQSSRPSVDRLEEDGNRAFTEKNQRRWAQVNDSLRQIHDRLQKAMSPAATSSAGGQEQDLPPTADLKEHFRAQVDEIRGTLKGQCAKLESHPEYHSRIKARAEGIAKDLDALSAAIDRVKDDLEPKTGLAQLRRIFPSSAASALKKRIDKLHHHVEM